MTSKPDYTADDAYELELAIRRALQRAEIPITLEASAALLSIAADHFAEHPPKPFLSMVGDLQANSLRALRARALCPRCRCEIRAFGNRTGRCQWCTTC